MLRILLYLWALPVTLLGMLVAVITRSSGGTLLRVDGVLEAATAQVEAGDGRGVQGAHSQPAPR